MLVLLLKSAAGSANSAQNALPATIRSSRRHTKQSAQRKRAIRRAASLLRRKERVRVYFPFEERWYEKNSSLSPYKVALLQEAGGVAEDAGGAGGEEGEVGALRAGGFLESPFKVGGGAVEDAFAVHHFQ